ncbi:MAG TPA: hypothetical protein VFV38_42655 [Ktedonobacteraceae bacterium]|nr:hypothetical protein [Ktedonobacteraceae bacterium]
MGIANLFFFVEPLADWHYVEMTDRRTKLDYATDGSRNELGDERRPIELGREVDDGQQLDWRVQHPGSPYRLSCFASKKHEPGPGGGDRVDGAKARLIRAP